MTLQVYENRYRSIAKSILWRCIGIIILAIITYFYTRKWIDTTIITSLHHFIFLFVYYFHERIWLKIRNPINSIKRSILKMFTYETILGNLILGTITFFITGRWKTATFITITYIFVKHIFYIFHEFIWKRVKLGLIGTNIRK
jgi:uncharacterized membrane protein